MSIFTKIKSKLDRIFVKIDFQIFSTQNPEIGNIVKRIIDDGLTYLQEAAIYDLMKIVINNEQKQIVGIIVETGCALGGSAIAIASVKSKQRPFFVYDVFGLIPTPSDRDGEDAHIRYKTIESGVSDGISTNKYYGYESDLYSKVVSTFEEFQIIPADNNISFVKGLYEDTLILDSAVSFAHIDCDWYDSVMCCLKQIEPCLSPGATMVIDDYYCYLGCKKAVDEYFHDKMDKYKFIKKNRLHIIKL